MPKNRSRRRWLWLGGAGLLILAVVALGFTRLRSNQAAAEQTAADQETVTAYVGNLSASASASGNVVARREATLSLELPGVVTEVAVRPGDAVRRGDLLLALKDDALQLNVAAAEQAVAIQEANLAALQAPGAAADIAAAEAVLASAQAALDALQTGPAAAEVDAAEANLRAAMAGVARARAQLNQAAAPISQASLLAAEADLAAAQASQVNARLANEADPTFATDQALQSANEAVAIAQARLDALRDGADAAAVAAAAAGLRAAEAQRDIAQSNLDSLLGSASASQVAAAEAQLAQAEASLLTLREGPSEAQVAAAEAQLAQARLGLEDAQAVAERARLLAPFDGIVAAVYVEEGAFASGAAVALLDPASLEVILRVDEIDVGQLAVGQPATITLETWPETAIDSSISFISPSATTIGGLVTYEVFLGLGDIGLPVLAGMTASANLITANRENVLLVPNLAINTDREQGTFFVNVVTQDENGQRLYEEVPITVGLRDAQVTQILDGIDAGTELLVGTPPTFNFGPGGGPFGNN